MGRSSARGKMTSMSGREVEFERAGEIIAQARDLRLQLGDKLTDPAFAEQASAIFAELIDLTEALLTERQAYESRLHRSPARPVLSEMGAGANP